MHSKKILSENLKKYRQDHRISQEELAARAELSTRGYGKIERGEVHPSLETLDKLARATGLSQSALLSDDGSMEPAVS
ncbi:MAG: helix-turn-helix transcriptional regulator [Peptococcaceae bacterium]|nr:helix-turn-helix transcriptional regulator [Peptococcaceae bacterium]MBQ3508639.1 helix-turn-helix transcriptional regulator [Peptococcaceae bacterium]MBR2627402.1 helix-turn-helix transcriptional regulator [Peptococcaceae bacterium]